MALSGLLLLARPAPAAAEQAQKAYDFVDTLGIPTHISREKAGTVMDDDGWPIIRDAIAEVGFRYVRATLTKQKGVTRAKEMNQLHGTRFNFKIDSTAIEGKETPLNPDLIDDMVGMTKQVGTKAILSYEGPNEYNSQQDDDPPNPDWADQLKEFMEVLEDRIRGDRKIADKPIVAPSIWRRKVEDYQTMAALNIAENTDKGTLHNYNGGRLPSYALLPSDDPPDRITNAQIMTGNQPIWVTEYGYRTHGANYVSEEAKAKYLPRYAGLLFKDPRVERAFNYQIIDEWPASEKPDKTWGLLRNDFSKRPAFYAMKNTIALLDDEDDEQFEPESLDFTFLLSGTSVPSCEDLELNSNMKCFLVQKNNGVFYLVLWQEVSSYDQVAKEDVVVSPVPLTLTFNSAVSTVRTYLPTGLDLDDPEEGRLPVDVYVDPNPEQGIPLDVPDELLIVEIEVAADPGGNTAPSAQFGFACNDLACQFTDLSSEGDGTIASWSWDFGDGDTSSTQNPSHTYAVGGTFTVTLTVTDNDGASDATPQQVTVTGAAGGILLQEATGYKVKGRQTVDLKWSGAGGDDVDVYRDDEFIATPSNDGFYTDDIGKKGGGSYVYQVCEAGTPTCSGTKTVTF